MGVNSLKLKICSPENKTFLHHRYIPVLKGLAIKGNKQKSQKLSPFLKMVVYPFTLTLLHSERPKLYAILAFLSALGLNIILVKI